MLEGENLTIVFAGTKYTLRKKTATVDSAERSAFLGTWDMIEGTGSYAGKFKSVTVVFDADGRWTLESVDSKGQKDSVGGRYTSKGGRAWFRENDDVVIELDAGRMTMSEDNTTFTFKRRDDAETAFEDTAAATAADSLLGTWEMIEVTGEHADDAGMGTWTFNPDGTLVIESTDAQGKSRIQTSPYTFKNGRISIAAGEDVVITIAGDLLTAIGANTKAVFRKKTTSVEASSSGEVDITPCVGSWGSLK